MLVRVLHRLQQAHKILLEGTSLDLCNVKGAEPSRMNLDRREVYPFDVVPTLAPSRMQETARDQHCTVPATIAWPYTKQDIGREC